MRYESCLPREVTLPGGGSLVFPKSRLRLYSSRAMSAAAIAADDRQDFARNVAGTLRRRQENVSRRNLLWLCRSLHRRVSAEFADILRLLVGRIERRPYGSGRDRVNPDPTRYQMRGKRSCERVNAALGHGVIEE